MTMRPARSKTDLYNAFTFSLILNVFNLKLLAGAWQGVFNPYPQKGSFSKYLILGSSFKDERDFDLKVCWCNSSLSRVRLTVCAVRNEEEDMR